ncbi:MAG TPA: zf-HC2 domain-containing protein [bacterium]|jgi:predicted anti-sigma-YlaC factor YlaD
MTHARAERMLSALLDNELTADDSAAVRAHLAQCEECRATLQQLTAVKQLLSALPEHEPPAGYWEVLRAAAVATAPARANPLDVFRAAFRRPAVALAAMAAVILLVLLPLVKGRVDRLRAAEIGVDVYVHEYAVASSYDPFADRAYLGLLIGDAGRALIGDPRAQPGDER